MSIRFKLLAVFGLLATLGITSFVGLWLYGLPMLGVEGLYAHEYKRAIQTVEALADKERDTTERWFEEHRRELRILSSNEVLSTAVQSMGKSTGSKKFAHDQVSRQLSAIAEASPGSYRFLFIVDRRSSQVLASAYAQPPSVPAFIAPALQEAFEPGMTEYIRVLQDANPQVLLIHQIVSRDAQGNPDGPVLGLLVAGLALDAPLNSNEMSMRQMLGVTGQVLLVDREARVLFQTSADAKVRGLGLVAEQVVSGTEGARLLTASSGEEWITVFRYIHLGASEDISLVVLRGTDDALASIRTAFWRMASVVGMFVLLATVLVLFATSRIARAEKEVKALNASLEQRIVERTRELEKANADLQSSMQHLARTRDELVRSEKLAALGALVAGIAHELNTPIGNSLTVASAMQDQAQHFSDALEHGLTRKALIEYVVSTREGADILMHSLQRAAELVSSFKQVAVDQTSQMRRQFRLLETLNVVLTTLGPTLRKSTHSVRCDVPDNITLDSYPGPLSQVVTNLVNNALLHGLDNRQGGEVLISAQLVGSDGVRCVFQDNGVGIAPANLARVFDPFFTTRLGKGGSGLGLHIVYNLVTQTLGGTIAVDSPPGEGARFTVTIPLIAPAIGA